MKMVDPVGIEPTTDAVQARLAPLVHASPFIKLKYYLISLIKCQKLLGTRCAHLATASVLVLALMVRLPILPLFLLNLTTNVFIVPPWLITFILYHVLKEVT